MLCWYTSGKDWPSGWLVVRTGRGYSGGATVQGPTPQSRIYFGRALEPVECTLWTVWWTASHQVLRPLGRVSGAAQGQPLPVPSPGPLDMSYKVVSRWLSLLLGLEVPGRGQAANWARLLLVPGLGCLARSTGHAKARHSCWGLWTFERFYKTQ